MKLIEATLPLEAINKEAARERSIRHGHPSTPHGWATLWMACFGRVTLYLRTLSFDCFRHLVVPADHPLSSGPLFLALR